MAGKTKIAQGYVNHVALVLDMSGSMGSKKDSLIKAVDELVAYMAQRSKEMDQETRVTIYTFASRGSTECVVYDKDVLRLPSIKDYYKPYGMTALLDATAKAMEDLAKTPELYGDHAFLLYAFTDGLENESLLNCSPGSAYRDNKGAERLKALIDKLPDNWTMAALVPGPNEMHEAKKQGFPNVAVWNAVSAGGVEEVGETIRRATDTFMQTRATGLRSTNNLFDMSAGAVNKETIKAAGLTPLATGSYSLVPVGPSDHDSEIRGFVQSFNGGSYKVGQAFYQLAKREKIQGQKSLAVVEKKTGKVFLGPGVRALVGLPEYETPVPPGFNPDYDIYVQSTSVNRKVKVGTKILVVH